MPNALGQHLAEDQPDVGIDLNGDGVTVWPDGTQPTSLNLNIEYADQTFPNLVIVRVGADGSIRVFTDAGTDLIVDVLGRLT
jgi:hypothetical protein